MPQYPPGRKYKSLMSPAECFAEAVAEAKERLACYPPHVFDFYVDWLKAEVNAADHPADKHFSAIASAAQKKYLSVKEKASVHY